MAWGKKKKIKKYHKPGGSSYLLFVGQDLLGKFRDGPDGDSVQISRVAQRSADMAVIEKVIRGMKASKLMSSIAPTAM